MTRCAMCWALPFAYDEGEGAVSPAAIADPPAWDKARAAVAFDDASKALVHLLKYRDQHEAGLGHGADDGWGPARNLLGGCRCDCACSAASPAALATAVQPVGTVWRSTCAQAADKNLACLTCSTGSRPQRRRLGLMPKNGAKMCARPLRCRPNGGPTIDGKTVLLVDDVRTTGATADACAATLKKAGAARVFVLSFALVLEPTRLAY